MTDTWQSLSNCISVSGGFGLSINNKGYMGTGWYVSDWYKTVKEYDPSSDNWTTKADFGGVKRYETASFSLKGKGYVLCGSTTGGTKLSDMWVYDPSSNTWTQKADFGGGNRVLIRGCATSTKGYAGTGQNGGQRRDFWEYDPDTNIWTSKPNFGGVARGRAAAFSIYDKVYMGTGGHADFWEYDPSGAGSWSRKADLDARSGASFFSVGRYGYIGTGYLGGSYLSSFYEYNQLENVWRSKASITGGRTEAMGFSIGTKGYIGSGRHHTGWYNTFFGWCCTPIVISGNVKDSDGHNLNDITITFEDGTSYETTTDSDGNYYQIVDPDVYTIEASVEGEGLVSETTSVDASSSDQTQDFVLNKTTVLNKGNRLREKYLMD